MSREPTLAEVIRTAMDSRLLDVHTCLPGKVESYTAATQTANVLPMVTRAVPTKSGGVTHEQLPIIHNVPIGWPSGGGFSMQFPLAAGDLVWLVFNEAAIAQWRTTGQVSAPGDLRRHDLSYPWAWPGCRPVSAPLTPAVGNVATVETPGNFVFGSQIAADYVALAAKVATELTAIKSAINGAAVLAGDGGATFKTNILAALAAFPGSVAASNLKAD